MPIPPALIARLRDTLARSAPFESDRALRTIFVDTRISQWSDDLPEASSKGERVQTTIRYLADKRNEKGENALWLFLRALCDQTPSTDSRHQELAALAAELEQVAPAPATPQWIATMYPTNPSEIGNQKLEIRNEFSATSNQFLISSFQSPVPPSHPEARVCLK